MGIQAHPAGGSASSGAGLTSCQVSYFRIIPVLGKCPPIRIMGFGPKMAPGQVSAPSPKTSHCLCNTVKPILSKRSQREKNCFGKSLKVDGAFPSKKREMRGNVKLPQVPSSSMCWVRREWKNQKPEEMSTGIFILFSTWNAWARWTLFRMCLTEQNTVNHTVRTWTTYSATYIKELLVC